MTVSIHAKEEYLAKACQEIVRVFYPGEDILINGENPVIRLELDRQGNSLTVRAWKDSPTGESFQAVDEVKIPSEAENTARRLARLAALRYLEHQTGRTIGPWGILTGIRPTKIVHRLMDEDTPQVEIIHHLIKNYALDKAKAELLVEVCSTQRPFLHSSPKARKLVSVYIGIPFCPTRCVYCSFPAYQVGKSESLIEPFLKALEEEISALGEGIKSQGLGVESIYVGGGTPTALNEGQLALLLERVTEKLTTPGTVEYTVEAGRPDSINRGKLLVLKEVGANRISINPQSMNPETLKTIGRCHSPEDIKAAFQLARETGFANINMDIIIGLPGETVEDVRKTLDQIRGLAPDNLTIHTLALKRASRLKEKQRKQEIQDLKLLAGEHEEAVEMLALAYEAARAMGMHPYYLYRQKQMLGHLENVGFARPGKECVYNIQMMEERQTVIGLGAGSGSKWVNTQDWTLLNTYNPKDPRNYIERINELINFKLSKLKS